jgi:hypothetical protein
MLRGVHRLRVSHRDLAVPHFWHHHVQLMETVWILVEIWRMDSFRDEAMGQVQEVHRVDIFQDCSSQSIAVHFLIRDPGGGVCYYSSLDGFYCVSIGGHGILAF